MHHFRAPFFVVKVDPQQKQDCFHTCCAGGILCLNPLIGDGWRPLLCPRLRHWLICDLVIKQHH